MGPPLILLPPSESKASGGTGAPYIPGSLSFPELDERRLKAAAGLRRAMRSSTATVTKLLGVKGESLASARLTNRAVVDAPTLPAIERYTGVLFAELDHRSLNATARRRLAQQALVVSGLWGVVAPNDPIPDYKLKMGATLPPLGRLATWWRAPITAALDPVVGDRTVWDLLPLEHAAAWHPAPGRVRRRLAVKFLDESPDGRLVAVSHWNKLLKGALVRHIVSTQLDDAAGLEEFVHPLGYRYRPDLTRHDPDRTVVSLVAPKR